MVVNAVFLLSISLSVPEILAIKIQSCPKSCQFWMLFARKISEVQAPKICTQIITYASRHIVKKFGGLIRTDPKVISQ